MTNRAQRSWWCAAAAVGALWFAGTAEARQVDPREACARALDGASRKFELGQLRAVIEDLEGTCVTAGGSRDIPTVRVEDRLHVRELLARTYLALDDLESARAQITQLLLLDPEFTIEQSFLLQGGQRAFASPLLARLLTEARLDRGTQVTSVSRTAEDIREAPATVAVVTADEIARRGYGDLEAVLHDLPGLQFARGNGEVYSNIYVRGLRSGFTDRILFLIDGIEQNDLYSNIVYLSRQYPLSNVARVEVVYGPSSTMYGANAYAGVINVITRSPADWLPAGGAVAFSGQAVVGSFATSFVDATVAGRSADGNLGWSISGRAFRSDEQDLSRFPEWDYAERGGAGGPFQDRTRDWSVFARLELRDLEVGVQSWNRSEGTSPWYADGPIFSEGQQLRASGPDAQWTPQQTAVYARYSTTWRRGVRVNYFGRFKQHELGEQSSIVPADPFGNVDVIQFDQVSRQLRNELTLTYETSPRWNLVAGIDWRLSSIQGDFHSSTPDGQSRHRDTVARFPLNQQPGSVRSQDLGFYAQGAFRLSDSLKLVAGGRVDHNRVAADQFLVLPDLARDLEDPDIDPFGEGVLRVAPGYGSVFNPRFALIWATDDVVLKGIYSEAFQAPTNFQTFGRVPGQRERPSPLLEPERVRNVELGARWSPSDTLGFELAAFRTTYTNIVGERFVQDEFDDGNTNTIVISTASVNLGGAETRGAQLDVRASLGETRVSTNLSWVDSVITDPRDGFGDPVLDANGSIRDSIPSGQIARLTANLLIDHPFGRGFDLSFRGNFVGPRPEGPAQADGFPGDPIHAYAIGNVSLRKRDLLPGTTLQVVVNNVFNTEYSDPRLQRPGLIPLAPRFPQPGRTLMIRLQTDFGHAAR